MQTVQRNSAVFSNADLFFMPPYLTQPTSNPIFISWINKFDHNHDILVLVNEWSCLAFFVASNFLIFSSFCMTTPLSLPILTLIIIIMIIFQTLSPHLFHFISSDLLGTVRLHFRETIFFPTPKPLMWLESI